MGSGSSRSSQVHSFQNDSSNSIDSRPLNKNEASESRNFQVRQSVCSSSGKNDREVESSSPDVISRTEKTEKDVLISQLKKELGESESTNLDLQDRIQLLEEQIYNLQDQNQSKSQIESSEETLKAKEHIISKINNEKDLLQKDMQKMKIRYKKRIKLLTSQVNEAKQETSIQLFELRDEINRLTEENQNLNEKLDNKEGNKQVFIETDYLSTSIHGNSSQMKVVLELSNQISDQQSRIEELEKQLKDRDELLKLNGVSLDQISQKKKRFSENEHVKQEKYAMRKLSESMFPNSNVQTTGSEDDLDTFSVEDDRGFSGASRDSGIGSAGKGGRTLAKSNTKKSVLSPLEDSDDSWESDTPLSSRDKIKSAPLENQYKRAASRASKSSGKTHESEDDCVSIDYDMEAIAKTTKLKKKTSFTQRLRKENEASIRTPVPYEAFGGDDVTSSSKTRKTKGRKQFFLTQSSSQGSTPTNEIDALLA